MFVTMIWHCPTSAPKASSWLWFITIHCLDQRHLWQRFTTFHCLEQRHICNTI